MKSFLTTFYISVARGLTLARLASTPLFLFLLVEAAREAPKPRSWALLSLYVFIALSDLLDGAFARKAGAPSRFWGRMDAAVDIVFNASALAAAAWIGAVGFWVPAGVAVLGARFVLRNLRRAAAARLDEDLPGKIAGVLYYLLVGAVALQLAAGGEAGRRAVARAGDLAFLYTLYVLLRGRMRLSRIIRRTRRRAFPLEGDGP